MKRFFITILFILIGAVIIFLTYDLVLYRIWVSLISPYPSKLVLSDPRQITEIPHNDYYLLKWSDDGTVISLFHSNWTASTPDLPSTIFNIDVQSGKVIDSLPEVPINSSNLTFNLRNAIRIERDETEWVKCLQGDVTVNLEHLDGDNHRLSVYQADTLSAAFNFSPFNPGYMPGYRSIRFMAFSPKCDYLALTFDGWAYYEGESRSELWLLDIPNKSLKPMVIGRWPLIKTADYPVQAVRPDWSPDGKKLVFGDKDFGLEIYNIETSVRSRLANLGHSGWDPKWSPSGEWISANQWSDEYDSVIVLSQSGQFFSSAGKCTLISDFEWSPVNDQLVYLCYDGKSMTDSLWIWEVKPSAK
jgi:Tol biopolymer transport system component